MLFTFECKIKMKTSNQGMWKYSFEDRYSTEFLINILLGRDDFQNIYFKFELKFCSLLIISGGASFLQQSDAPVGQIYLTPGVKDRFLW